MTDPHVFGAFWIATRRPRRYIEGACFVNSKSKEDEVEVGAWKREGITKLWRVEDMLAWRVDGGELWVCAEITTEVTSGLRRSGGEEQRNGEGELE